MWKNICFAIAIFTSFGMAPFTANAVDLSHQKAIKVVVALGTKGGDLKFSPNKFTFDAGKLYKLVLINPSPTKHYFTALRFASAVWTRKVEVNGAEVKGTVTEIEVKAGGEAEWFFVPVQAGTYHLKCKVKGHAHAGMVGEITVR